MDRRQFVVAALGSLGSAGVLAGTGIDVVRGAPRRSASAAVQATLVRRNVYCMTEYSREIIAYKNAINVMRARPVTDPTSWQAQANIHASFTAPAGMITDACQHGNLFFLSWHRMYLYYFERIVRAASGDPLFALPYWGYSPTGNRTLPELFRSPADATNPLYASQRNASINGGAAISASAVDAGPALTQLGFSGFSSSLESTPHGVVHTATGGPVALPLSVNCPNHWMSCFETAGQDPIFWLHHANLDRLWEGWLASGGGRANPTGSWLTNSFNFYDENGATVSMTGAQILDTAGQLGYRYDSGACFTIAIDRDRWRRLTRWPFPDPRIIAILDTLGRRPPLPGPQPLTQVQAATTLSGRASEVRLPVSADGRRRLRQFPTDPRTGRELALQLDDIQVQAGAAVYYEVYVNLPPGTTDTVYTSPHYVGNIDFFASPRHPIARTLPLLPAYARLRALGRWRDDTLRLTLVPRALTEDQDPEELLAQKTQAVIGRIQLHVQ